MTILFQADKNFTNNSKHEYLAQNITRLIENGNNYRFVVDDEHFISLFDIKIKKLRKILDEYSDDEIITYIDAFDTYVVAEDKEIEEKFLKMDADVIYSIEKNCWPDNNLSSFFSDNYFLNSGGLVFKNGQFKKILDLLSSIGDSILNNQSLVANDQYLHHVFALIATTNIKIKFDTNNEIFQSLIFEETNNFLKENNRFTNLNTKTQPCIFHGNGTDGLNKLKSLLQMKDQQIHFLRWFEDKNGIYFTNQSNILAPIHTKIKVVDYYNNTYIYFQTELFLDYGVEYYVSLNPELKNRFKFLFYDENDKLILELDNEYKDNQSIFSFIEDINTINIKKSNQYSTRNKLINLFEEKRLLNKGAEIGVYAGDYSKEIINIWKGDLILVDPWRKTNENEYRDVTNFSDLELQMYDCFKKLKEYINRVHFLRTTSQAAAELIKDESLDFVYIDANHKYDFVKQDIELWFPKIRKDGIIAGHNYLKIDWYNNDALAANGKDKYIYGHNHENPNVFDNYLGVFGVNAAVDEFCKKFNLKLNLTDEFYSSWFITKE